MEYVSTIRELVHDINCEEISREALEIAYVTVMLQSESTEVTFEKVLKAYTDWLHETQHVRTTCGNFAVYATQGDYSTKGHTKEELLFCALPACDSEKDYIKYVCMAQYWVATLKD